MRSIHIYLSLLLILCLSSGLHAEEASPVKQQKPPLEASEPDNNSGASADSSDSDDSKLPKLPPYVYKALAPEKKFSKLSKQILGILSARHYLDLFMDNTFSEQLFRNYLKRLDPGYTVLTQKDVNKLSAYHQTLDDALLQGNLAPAYEIFNHYHRNALAGVEQQLEKLKQKGLYFDFEKDEDLVVEYEHLPRPKDAEAAADLWRKRLKDHALNLRIDNKSDQQILQNLKQLLQKQQRQLQRMLPQDVFSIYMNSATKMYDSHTNYMSPTRAENFNISMRLSLEGIGAMLRQSGEYIEVVRISKGGPAERQGELRAGDRILGVAQEDGKMEDVVGWRLNEVIGKIRGRRGTKVRLKVLPTAAAKLEDAKVVAIVRDKIKLEKKGAQKNILEIEHEGENYRVGVIDLPSFYLDFRARNRRESDYRSTSRDVLRLLEELRTEEVDALIIDLRNNSGGSLEEANNLVGLFIEQGPVVQVRQSNGRVVRQGKLRRSAWYDEPMAVLVNRLSASASEIFAAAIQDYRRGLVIGSQSYGKGTVQFLHKLSHGQVKITDSKFYRISGGSTQLRGVMPDVRFPFVYDAQSIGESNLENALPWDQIRPVRHRNYDSLQFLQSEIQARHEERTAEDPEFLYLRARMEHREKQQEALEIVSLNEQKRRAERKKWKRLEKELKKIREPQKELSSTQQKTIRDDRKDPLLWEAGRIVLDSLYLQNRATRLDLHSKNEGTNINSAGGLEM